MRRTNADQELRRIGQFTDDPKLQRVLAEQEQNIHRAVNAHKEQKADRHQATPIAKDDVRTDFGQTLLYDTTGGPFQVFLPKVTQKDHGKTIRLKAVSSVLTSVIVTPATGQLIDGAANKNVVGDKIATHLYCDGNGWWSV
jgi:hypothetical protein